MTRHEGEVERKRRREQMACVLWNGGSGTRRRRRMPLGEMKEGGQEWPEGLSSSISIGTHVFLGKFHSSSTDEMKGAV